MKLKFWGVRGSYPVPGLDTVKVGGNTTCVSIEFEDHILVFDAGTGITDLGRYLEDDDRSLSQGCIFLSHYHWDHIQGLPFFAPAFRSENRFHLFGEEKKGLDLYTILDEQMQIPYFPVPMDVQEGLVTFNAINPDEKHELKPGLSVSTLRLRHPNGALGFRIDCGTGAICIITDHEHPEDQLDHSVVEFARGADVLIHDAPYDPDEKHGPKNGWGHSSWEEAAETAREAGIGTLFLSHHDPDRTDSDLFDIENKAKRAFAGSHVAVEGIELTVGSGG